MHSLRNPYDIDPWSVEQSARKITHQSPLLPSLWASGWDTDDLVQELLLAYYKAQHGKAPYDPTRSHLDGYIRKLAGWRFKDILGKINEERVAHEDCVTTTDIDPSEVAGQVWVEPVPECRRLGRWSIKRLKRQGVKLTTYTHADIPREPKPQAPKRKSSKPAVVRRRSPTRTPSAEGEIPDTV